MMRAAILFALMLSAMGCSDLAETESKATANLTAAGVEKQSDQVTLKILTHDEIQSLIKSHHGKVVVVDAWSTSCPPCMKEFPHLVEMHNELDHDKLACVSLSFDYEGIDKPEDQQQRVLTFLEGQKATFDNVLNRDEADSLYKQMKIKSVPTVLVYDQKGELRQMFDSNYRNAAGERFGYKDVRGLVEELLKS